MSLDHLYPFAGQHAIQSAVFGLDFSSELEVSEVATLRAAASQLIAEFANINDQHRTTLNLQAGPGAAAAPSTTVEVGGFILERPSLVSTEPSTRLIIVNRTGIIIVINDYTRWDRFKSDVDRYLSALFVPMDNQKAISSIGLQFNDIFLWKADPVDLNLSEIFAANNVYLAPNALMSPLLWHSHHGYLKNETVPVKHQQLDNINVSRVAANEEHQIQILTSHRVTLEKPLYKSWSMSKNILFELQENLHSKNKEILGALLTPEAQLKINLSGASDL